MKKSTKLGHKKGSGIAGNHEYVGVGKVGYGVQCWLVCKVCVSVLCSGTAATCSKLVLFSCYETL